MFVILFIVGTHGWLRFVPLSITRGGSCKHQFGRMIIIKDDYMYIDNSWGSMSNFVKPERSLQRTSVSLFKMATMKYLVCEQFDSKVVVMLPFLQKSFVLIRSIWLDSQIKHYVSDRVDVNMIPHGWWREKRSLMNRGFRRWIQMKTIMFYWKGFYFSWSRSFTFRPTLG